eukprot:g2852.t1
MGKMKELLSHPEELYPTLQMYLAHKRSLQLPSDPDRAFCFNILNEVSRSFAIVIHQLPVALRDITCIFYLVLRALDTVEDDMSIPVREKLRLLRNFHKLIQDPSFSLSFGSGHYRVLLEDFSKVNRVLINLDKKPMEVILDITKQMGHGMAEFIEKEVISEDDFSQYCFYVAGLVGVGLSKLFAEVGLESEKLRDLKELPNHMGQFLQKTNILRDYLEDIMEEPAPRMFWPKDIWSLYTDQLENFRDSENRSSALKCLNHLLLDVLRHLPGCFEYLEMLKTPSILRFCALPQIMAIGTMSLCFNNGSVFEGVVKLRKGLTCRIFDSTHSMKDVYYWFQYFLIQMKKNLLKAELEESVRQRGQTLIEQSLKLCKNGLSKTHYSPSSFLTPYWFTSIGILALINGWIIHIQNNAFAMSPLMIAVNIVLICLLIAFDSQSG